MPNMDTYFMRLPSIMLATSLIAAFVEAIIIHVRSKNYPWSELRTSLAVLGIRIILEPLIPLALVLPLSFFLYRHRIATQASDSILSLIILALLIDFAYYWVHRLNHRVRWFWAAHSVHHSAQRINFGTAVRVSFMAKICGDLALLSPLAWVGFKPELIFAAYTVNLLYQTWIHSEWMPKMGWLEGILNTPSAHRVHHATNTPYLDKNFGGIFMIFDRMFGTYQAELAEEPCVYGIVPQIDSTNVFTIMFSETITLFKDLLNTRKLKSRVKYLTYPPGWKADPQG